MGPGGRMGVTGPVAAGHPEPASMKDSRLIATEVLLPRPKRFVREELEMPDGKVIDWYYIDTPASVMVLPVTAAGNLVLVRQYRHNLKCHTLEFPAGTLSDGENAEEAAAREMEEETGFTLGRAAKMQFLGRYYSLPSETNRYTHFYLARPVASTGTASGDTEIEKYFDMSIAEMPADKAYEMIGREISGIETIGALLMARSQILV
jgi:ADP-ribose pyrophosphatase